MPVPFWIVDFSIDFWWTAQIRFYRIIRFVWGHAALFMCMCHCHSTKQQGTYNAITYVHYEERKYVYMYEYMVYEMDRGCRIVVLFGQESQAHASALTPQVIQYSSYAITDHGSHTSTKTKLNSERLASNSFSLCSGVPIKLFTLFCSSCPAQCAPFVHV